MSRFAQTLLLTMIAQLLLIDVARTHDLPNGLATAMFFVISIGSIAGLAAFLGESND